MNKMKKYIIISIVALSSLFSAQAQVSKSVTYPASLEINQAKSVWFNTTNAAGMIITPVDNFNLLTVGYSNENGEYKLQQDGDSKNNLAISTEGATNLGEARIWGKFQYNNSTINGTKFNTIMLDPVADMPYYIADPNKSYWKKQSYDMELKAATPVLWDVVGFGIAAKYYTKTGAKQIDPRCSSFKYGISATPSVIVKIGETHTIGLSATYENSFERTTPINSDSQHDQDAYVMKGLGNYSVGVVGGLGGLSIFYYKQNLVGGAIQYGYHSDFDVLAEGNYSYQVIDVFQTPSKPKRMGSTVQTKMGGNIQAIFNGDYTSKVTVDGYYKNTNGIEFIQELDKTYEVQQWVTMAKFIRSYYKFTAASLNYDLFKVSEQGYDWRAGLKATYSDRSDEYILPKSTLAAKNVYAELNGKKNFMVGNSSVLLGVNVGYNYNIDGGYDYTGANPTSTVVKEMFERDIAFLTANYIQAGINVNASFPVSKSSALYVQGDCQYIRSNDHTNNLVGMTDADGSNFRWETISSILQTPSQRIFATVSVGFTF